jgi:hypothetical protein
MSGTGRAGCHNNPAGGVTGAKAKANASANALPSVTKGCFWRPVCHSPRPETLASENVLAYTVPKRDSVTVGDSWQLYKRDSWQRHLIYKCLTSVLQTAKTVPFPK